MGIKSSPKASAGNVLIYMLSDPRNPRVPKYIGRTAFSIKRRISAHKCWAKKHHGHPMADWIISIFTSGYYPHWDILEECSIEHGGSRETHWIRFFRPIGSLTNKSDGNGSLGIKLGSPCMENRLKTIERNKRGLSDESRRKISQAMTGRKMPEPIKKKWMASDGFAVAMEKLSESNKRLSKQLIAIENGRHFDSIRSAARELGVGQHVVQRALKRNKSVQGLTLKYIKTE